jgi:hypothetical protein
MTYILQLTNSPFQKSHCKGEQNLYGCFKQEKFTEGMDMSHNAYKSFSQANSGRNELTTAGFSTG